MTTNGDRCCHLSFIYCCSLSGGPSLRGWCCGVVLWQGGSLLTKGYCTYFWCNDEKRTTNQQLVPIFIVCWALWSYVMYIVVAIVSQWYEGDVAVHCGWTVGCCPYHLLSLFSPCVTSSILLLIATWHLDMLHEKMVWGERRCRVRHF